MKAKTILLYDPGIGSMNVGDKIISDGAKKQLKFLTKGNFVTEMSTHQPLCWYYMRHFKNVDYKFVCGSNLLKSTFFGLKKQWNINLRLSYLTGDVILVGAGWWQYNNKMNWYTKILLRRMLSNNYLHSVRDEYTKKMLENIGITNVVNTSCSTMWGLTKEHCAGIPTQKSESVIFTITDYLEDLDNDVKLINTLLDNYTNVYFFPQGLKDMDYFSRIGINNGKIKIISPSIEEFDQILKQGNIDYIGTRLHGGIRALQHKIRTLIIAVDNRALEKKCDFNLEVINREDIDDITQWINTPTQYNISIPIEAINQWVNQFEETKVS